MSSDLFILFGSRYVQLIDKMNQTQNLEGYIIHMSANS